MNKELELWHFVADRLHHAENVMLLVVAESSGSSPGRQGYKMAVGADGEMCGSIGGGAMEVSLVNQASSILSVSPASKGGSTPLMKDQVHRNNVPNSSGMICSGKQTVIFKLLDSQNLEAVENVIDTLKNRRSDVLAITRDALVVNTEGDSNDFHFEKLTDNFVYTEKLGFKNALFIIGGGHCALALSELMFKMDFHISIFDDRPGLDTIKKNQFAHEINIIDCYENIGNAVPSGENIYVVVMTLGYRSDGIVIRQLLEKDLRYFGVLGSKAKMATLLKEIEVEGFPSDKLSQIHTPIGLPINSRTPEEIAVSIAAQIISVKNTANC